MNTAQNVLISMLTAALTSIVIIYGQQYLSGVIPSSMGKRTRNDNVQIPSVVGLTVDQGRSVLGSRGLTQVISEKREDEEVPEGNIIEQNPLEGSVMKKGAAVNVIISQGKLKQDIPNLSGLLLNHALIKLSESSFTMGTVTREAHDEIAADHVIRSGPGEGERAAIGSKVDLVVSDGIEKIKVPNILGKGLKEAKQILKEAKLEVGRVSYRYNDNRKGGVVLKQEPAAETMAEKGTAVLLIVNEFDY